MSDETAQVPAPADQQPATAPAAQATQATATSMLTALQTAASDPHVDVDKLERLYNMHERMQASQARTAYRRTLGDAREEHGYDRTQPSDAWASQEDK